MSYGGSNQYGQYGGNPYEQGGEYGASANPYGSTTGGYGASNPYGTASHNHANAPPLQHHEASNYSQASQYSEIPMGGQPNALPTQGPRVIPNDDFLTRVNACKNRINNLTTYIADIAKVQQRILSEPDSTASSAQLEGLVTNTQNLNMTIKDEIKFLETDAARSGGNVTKDSQIRNLKSTFTKNLQEYQSMEAQYRERYREQIKRQYMIVNPEASQTEVEEAADLDWGSEGVFQTALKSNRSGHASSVLGAVRARHNDIQRIEKTMEELATLFIQLNEAVVLQDSAVNQTELQTEGVVKESERANEQLDKGIEHIKRRNRLRRWTLFVFILIICIIALVLGLYFGLHKNNNNNNNA
ncbi:t-SNARE [Saccharata proteae CBS 121410]|uniref:t-SNARE n=1 Tax=Saccharata proteae CBS 121410 TaxID=1314787 RepID=A0A9P4LZT6_9PEZI|nr:t-SNARE [Saccharata proteae CBS 121410]